MYNGSPYFVRFRRIAQRRASNLWWALMAPGLLLMLSGIAILIWPELLAYLIALAMLMAGASLIAWGWSMRRLERRQQRQQGREQTIHYEVM
jgi:hypothetical protein